MAETTREALTGRIAEIAERVGQAEGIEVVEMEFLGGGKQRLLRFYIDKPDGVTHGDCENFSQKVGSILDAEDVVPGENYTLEVSSPGVERKLLRAQDYQRFQGKKASITLRQPVEGQKHWDGMLAGFQDGTVTLEIKPGKTIAFPFDQVLKAHLKFEW